MYIHPNGGVALESDLSIKPVLIKAIFGGLLDILLAIARHIGRRKWFGL